jgi:hypothetical protein
MELREGQCFRYNGEDATVRWREFIDDIAGKTQHGIVVVTP